MTAEALQGDTDLFSTESGEFPTDRMERLGAVLSVVHAGPKSYLLRALPENGDLADLSDLSAMMASVVKQTNFKYSINTLRLVQDYLEQSLVNIGMVVKVLNVEAAGHQIPVAYGLTQAGIRYGIPAASMALVFEQENPDISLYEVFGSTSSHSNLERRAPIDRAMILMYMQAMDRPVSYPDIHHNLPHVDKTVAWQSLQNLTLSGVIERVTSVDGYVVPPVGERDHAATELFPDEKVVYDACKMIVRERKVVSLDRLLGFMGLLNDPEVVSVIQYTLTVLTQKHLLAEHYRNEYGFTPTGRIIVSNFLTPLMQLVSDEPIEGLADIVTGVGRNLPMYAINAIDHYAPHARATKRQELAKVTPLILACVADFPEGITLQDLAKNLDQKWQSLRSYIEKMVEAGTLTKTRSKSRMGDLYALA